MVCFSSFLASLNRNGCCFVLGACCLLLLPVIGCGRSGPEIVPVEGTITYGGGPWPIPGILQFVANPSEPNQSLRPAAGHFDTDGHLVVTTFEEGDGLVPGKYVVGVTCYATPRSKTKLDSPKNYVPVRYRSPATSGFTVTVEPGQRLVELNFDVPKK